MAPQAFPSATQERRSAELVSVDGRTYPLRSAHIRGRAEGGLAQSTLVQEFANPHDEPLEVLYTMPLPADGAVLGYTIRIGERVIRGEIEPRDKAEATYKEALYEGRTAGLLERDRADTFQQRLGNVPPKTDVRVEIDVLHPLSFLAAIDAAGPLWEYRFPTVVGVRYEGTPGRVSDAERLEVDRDAAGGIPTRFGVSLAVADDVVAGGGIASSSHEILCVANAVGTQVTLPEDARLDSDLVVRWPAGVDEVGVRVVEGGGLEGDNGRYALLTLTPPRVPAVALHRDLTVLLDASGSMRGEPLEAAKRVVANLLESLEEGDRFEVLAFAHQTRPLTRGMENASADAVERAVRAVRAVEADGGTEMVTAFEKALASLRRDSQRQIVLVTDGQIGFEEELLEKLSTKLPSGVRVHTVGIGSAVNRTLTTGAARAGRGVELLAGGKAEADEAALRLRAATVRPVLTEIRVAGSAVVGVAPEHLRDVFAGMPLVVALELNPEGGVIEMKAVLSGGKDVWMWRTEVTAVGEAAAGAAALTPLPIGALYGRELIADAETHPRRGRSREELDTEVEAIGLRHHIASRSTSLVAVAEEPSVDPNAPRRREKLALELPAGVAADAVLSMGVSAHSLDVRLIRSPSPELLAEEAAPFVLSHEYLTRGPSDPSRPLFVPEVEWAPDPGVLFARAIRVDRTDLTIEIQVREDGFLLPQDEVRCSFRGPRSVTVVPDQSSAAGPHVSGTWVRLTVRLSEGETWPTTAVSLFWEGRPIQGEQRSYRIVINPGRAPIPRAGA